MDSSILGSVLGSPYFGKLPYVNPESMQNNWPKHPLSKPARLLFYTLCGVQVVLNQNEQAHVPA